jgi:hypothetical protein
MKRLLILLSLCQCLLAQWAADSLLDEMEEPDENSFYEILMEQLFDTRGEDDVRSKSMILRQRLSHSSSSSGWTILNKARYMQPGLSLSILLEQDPTEAKLADHQVITLSTESMLGLSQLIIGDFQARWGMGYLYDQPARRRSLATSSLVSHSSLKLRPHFSTSETGFFRGVAFSKQMHGLTIMGFGSQRMILGKLSSDGFKADSDGRHPSEADFTSQRERALGAAARVSSKGSDIYLAGMLKASEGPRGEWGIRRESGTGGLLQTGGDFFGNYFVAWNHAFQILRLSTQFRRQQDPEVATGTSPFSGLTPTGNTVHGISTRLQLHPGKHLAIRLALDQDIHLSDARISALEDSQRKNLELVFKSSSRKLKFEYGQQLPMMLTPTDGWHALPASLPIQKLGFRLEQDLTRYSRYVLVAKTAGQDRQRSYLIQQVLKYQQGAFRADLGYALYQIDDFYLRIGAYESSPLESFGFFTAYDDGQRFSCYVSYQKDPAILELKLARATQFALQDEGEVLLLNFQLSIVL